MPEASHDRADRQGLVPQGPVAKELFAKDLVGAQRSIRLHLIVGLAVVVVLAVGLGGWASTQEIPAR